MTIACQIVNVVTPANITATNMMLDRTDCTAFCNVTVTIEWTNTGGTTGTFAKAVSVYKDGEHYNTYIFGLNTTLGPGLSTTGSHTITGLPAGIYSICPNPN